MRTDELHKFSDGTLNDVRSDLDDILKRIRMEYLPQTIWRNVDRERAGAMIQAIDQQLRNKRLLRSLENLLVGDRTGETFDCWKGPYDLSYDVLIKNSDNGNEWRYECVASLICGCLSVGFLWKLGGSPAGIHGLFSGWYCGLAGRMVTLRVSMSWAKGTKILPSPKRDNPTKDSVCHHYHEVGYWRRNCPSYHADLKKRKNASIASTSGIFTIKLYAFPNKTWVYDTGCGTHICNTSQGLRGSRKLKYGALSLYVGNGMPAAVEVIGSFDLVLPNIRGIRILLAIAAFYDYEIWQMDVNTTFLNGHLSEDQASRSWNKRFDVEIKKIGFTQNLDEPYVYLKASESNVVFLILYVDDILLMQNPGEIHQTVVKAILKYLRNTKDVVLVYGAKPEAELKVSCYVDASFQTDKDDTKSQTGYVFVLNGGDVDWKSTKQSTTAMSSTEAEYIFATEASMEAVWMRKFIDGLGGVVSSNKRPMKYHYIREVIQEREIVLKKVHIDDNVADSFTKPMPYDKHYEHAMAIGIVPARSLM
ncbi:retrovirus-related pol polyprotein from transposon TNT 1-94 [Tanacetum coccineum]